MIFNPEVKYVWTEDDIRLQGMHYWVERKDVCVLLIHGQSANFLDNKFGNVLGRKCAENGYGFLYAHNRGWGVMNDLTTKKRSAEGGYEFIRGGAVHERFEDCVLDIDIWVKKVLELGYKRIILLGHSLAGPKTIFYLNGNKQKEIVGLVLASPADMVGTTKIEEGDRYQEMIKEAEQNVALGKPEKLLSHPVGGWVRLSSQTFLSESVDGCPADVFPLLRNPKVFPKLASIQIPILGIMSQYDSVSVHSPEEDLKILKEKAVKSVSVNNVVIPDADHVYQGKEREFSEIVVGWVKSLQ